MKNSYKKIRFGDIADITSSKRVYQSEYVSTGVPFFRSKEIIEKSKNKNVTTELFISEEKYNEFKSKFGVPRPGDLLITAVGTLGVPYQVKESDYFYFKDGNLIWFRNLDKRLSSDFLLYLLKSDHMQQRLKSIAIGSSQSAFTISAVKDIQVELPNIKIQEKVADILSAYDDLIENNTRRIQVLEKMAQAIYKEWFVSFKFPGHEKVKMVNSGTEFGKIPEGWKVRVLGEVVQNFDSRRRPISKMKRQEIQGVVPYYGAAKVIDYVNDYIFDGKYLLMAEDGSVITKLGNPVLQFVNEKFWPNNHTHILQGTLVSTEFLYLYLSQFSISGYITGVAQPKINQGNLNRIPVLVPDKKTSEIFDGFVAPVFEEVWNLGVQNRVLRQARDLLLPKLVSGAIKLAL